MHREPHVRFQILLSSRAPRKKKEDAAMAMAMVQKRDSKIDVKSRVYRTYNKVLQYHLLR
jgi:hypothetical protein